MEYLIRYVHVHEAFRVPETRALARLAGVELSFVHYDESSPFCLVKLRSNTAAQALAERAILIQDVYELWGQADDYASLQASLSMDARLPQWRAQLRKASFRFDFDSFQGSRNVQKRRELIDSFKFLDFKGPIVMKDPDFTLCVFEEYKSHVTPEPRKLYFGQWVARGSRDIVNLYDLKKRAYISRTSMDAELSLVTANLALAAPGKLVYDPFVGTGSFSVACAHFGSLALGSDIDARSIRGTEGKNIVSNFVQYNLASNLLDNVVADVTNTPIRAFRFLDAIVCDPPYGVREGPKVLGYRSDREPGASHLREGYVPPKRPYGFDSLVADLMDFGCVTLVDGGTLSLWMPTANDEDVELAVPLHPGFKLISTCVQHFNKWSRRLLTYERITGVAVNDLPTARKDEQVKGSKANDLNSFRRRYFEGFKAVDRSLDKR